MNINILHISDLHLEEFKPQGKNLIKSRFQENNFQTKFYKTLKDNCNKLDYVIITGDLANKGISNEYTLVREFLDEIIKKTSVKKENILICPGNHDINWGKSEKAYINNANKEINKGNPRPNEKESFKFHQEKFEDFKKFYDNFYSNNKIEFNSENTVFRDLKIKVDNVELQICIINSCFEESHYPDNHHGYIEHGSLDKYLEQQNSSTLKIALLHHVPISINKTKVIDNWDEEIKYLCKIHNIRLFLFGHQHKNQGNKLSEGKNEFLQYSVGAFAKIEDGVNNSFNILSLSYNETESNIEVKKTPFHYINDGDELDWHLLEKKVFTEKLSYEKPQIEEPNPVALIGDEKVNYEFPKKIELFSKKLVEIISNNNLFNSGHYHWNPSTRTLGFIDTYSLLSKRVNSLVAKGSILELYNSNILESDFILGIGQEGNVLGGFLAMDKGLPFTSIPYHSRNNDYSKHEKDLNIKGHKTITIVTDVIHSASSIMNIVKEKVKSFEHVEKINLLSLFYISKEKEYHPNIFSSLDKRIKFYTVSDKIKIDKCMYSNKEFGTCSIFCNKLEKVHIFYSKT